MSYIKCGDHMATTFGKWDNHVYGTALRDVQCTEGFLL